MRSLTLSVPGSSIFIVPTADESRPKGLYENGKPTGEQATFENGKPIFTTEGMVAIHGKRVGNVRIESPASELPETPLNALFVGKGEALLQIFPQDNFNIRVTVSLPDGFEVAK